MEDTILKTFEENTAKLLDFIQQVDDSKLLVNPTRKEWSIMDCCEHILQLEQALMKLFRGPVEKVDAQSSSNVDLIKERFLDFSRKLTAFGVILPQRKYKSKTEISEALKETRKMLLRIGKNNGWNKKCMLYAHPLFGHLTRLEWIAFCIYHVERHLNQMEETLTKI
ncbi:MAG: DinB family protein [Flammeovirgaceae bacterium]